MLLFFRFKFVITHQSFFTRHWSQKRRGRWKICPYKYADAADAGSFLITTVFASHILRQYDQFDLMKTNFTHTHTVRFVWVCNKDDFECPPSFSTVSCPESLWSWWDTVTPSRASTESEMWSGSRGSLRSVSTGGPTVPFIDRLCQGSHSSVVHFLLSWNKC